MVPPNGLRNGQTFQEWLADAWVSVVAHPDAAELGEIAHLITEKKVHPHVEARIPLDHVAEAHEKAEHGHPRGKIVLEIRPS